MGQRRRTAWCGAAVLTVFVGVGCGARAAGDVSTSGDSDPSTSTITGDVTSTSSSTTSSTSTSTTTPSSTTSTTTPPSAPARWHFDGSHAGVEHFEGHTTRCTTLDHQLSETFTLTDGTTWTFNAVYCGTIDANLVWTGVGSLEIATGHGSLSGTFTDSAQLPTSGVPYQLDIHSGSGEFAGATGSCLLDNHLRTTSAGVQEQSGTFACDLHR